MQIYTEIAAILQHAQHTAYRSVNGVMIQAYWNIGQKIVEHEQQGNDRAAYGTKLIPQLAKRLTEAFGKGFNATNLFYMKQFYLEFPILHALRGELTWTHYRLLLKVQNETARQYYLQESIDCQWSTRELERQVNSFYYERILSTKKPALLNAADQSSEKLTAVDVIKDPFVLEFLGVEDNRFLSEQALESALMDKL